jgi:aminotransferase
LGKKPPFVPLEYGEIDVMQMQSAYDERRRVLVEGFNRLGMTCFEPRGAFYAFPSIAHTGMSDEEFCELLLKEDRVALVPGSAFGESGRGFIRASYASSLENIQEALYRLENFLERHGWVSPLLETTA